MIFGGTKTSAEWLTDRYLKTALTDAGRILHWGVISATAISQGLKRFGELWDTTQGAQWITSKLGEAGSLTATIYKCLRDPNLEGIPILSPKISVSREVDVSENSVIVPENYQRMYIIDNAVPHPRTWSVTGYLTSLNFIDAGMVLKPTLMSQAKMLDAFAKSRRVMWFKTDENEMVKVQITSLTMERTAEASNAYSVSMTLKEFTPLQLTTSPWSVVTAIRSS